jgi:hypothetical protein
MPARTPSPPRRALEALAFSGLWAGAVAAALTWAAGSAIGGTGGLPRLGWACGLAAAGTVVVYTIDRLRDLQRDAATSPARSAFVSRHRVAMQGLAVGAALLCVPLALQLPQVIWAICGVVLGLGLLHRRLKDHERLAIGYVSLAWVAIVVGLPAVLAPWSPARVAVFAVTAGCLGLAVASNAMASDLRGLPYDARAALTLRRARHLALAGALVPIAFAPLRALALVGVAAWIALALFRPDERYGLIVLDGALLVGGVLAAGMTALAGP